MLALDRVLREVAGVCCVLLAVGLSRDVFVRHYTFHALLLFSTAPQGHDSRSRPVCRLQLVIHAYFAAYAATARAYAQANARSPVSRPTGRLARQLSGAAMKLQKLHT